MNRKTANIDIRVEPELIGRIEDWLDEQRVPPSFSAAVVYMITDFLDREGARIETNLDREKLSGERGDSLRAGARVAPYGGAD